MGHLCACGRELHYESPDKQHEIEELIAMVGEFVKTVMPAGKSAYLIPRHFMALHTPRIDELPELAKRFGFREVIMTNPKLTNKPKKRPKPLNTRWAR
jgi:hypothetical protein